MSTFGSRSTRLAASLALIAGATAFAASAQASEHHGKPAKSPINHVVVIYEENHSFDNLYGLWPGVNGQGNADWMHTVQVGPTGVPLSCLPQNDVNLTSPGLPATCTDGTTATSFSSAFPNKPFRIDDYIAPTDTTCPAPGVFAATGVAKSDPTALPGGCTRDIVHRFYEEQYQIDGGKMDRYTAGSDAVGLTQGYYDTTKLPVYQYLTAPGAPKYTVADNFFQAAFGGSFLNHQWLIAAATPVYANADHSGGSTDLHSIVGTDGSPANYPLHPTTGLKNAALTVDASNPSCQYVKACGDYAINTIQPAYLPYSSPTAAKLPPLTNPTIGDELSTAGVDWAWYSGGWSNADGDVGAPGWTNGTGTTCTDPNASTTAVFPNCPDKLFQYHHQPFNYFANYAPGTQARADHLRDEEEFLASAAAGTLKAVSFVKPLGEENEHPGYASTHDGEDHLVELIKAIENGPNGADTAIIVTYDEFGGQWDHVPPPTATGVSDIWGPGTRIPALIISPKLRQSGVDHTQYDTTSILASIEHRFGLAPLSTRDAAVNDIWSLFTKHH